MITPRPPFRTMSTWTASLYLPRRWMMIVFTTTVLMMMIIKTNVVSFVLVHSFTIDCRYGSHIRANERIIQQHQRRRQTPIISGTPTTRLHHCARGRILHSSSRSSSNGNYDNSNSNTDRNRIEELGARSSGINSLFQNPYYDGFLRPSSGSSSSPSSVVANSASNDQASNNDNDDEQENLTIVTQQQQQLLFESLIEAATATTSSGDDSSLLGGDFAGIGATFHPVTGAFIPIPEYLIPPSLLEWGQEPKCLEFLVSEDFEMIEDEESTTMDNDDSEMTTTTTSRRTMKRVTTTVLPDTGCSVDNLETTKATDHIDLIAQWSSATTKESNGDNNVNGSSSNNDWDTNTIVALKYPLVGKSNNNGDKNDLRLETIFGLDDSSNNHNNNDDDADDDSSSTSTSLRGHRLRVVLDIQIDSWSTSPNNNNSNDDESNGIVIGVQTPMMIMQERKTSSISSGGTIGDGGGLDGRTVSLLLGDTLRSSQTFVDTQPPIGTSYVDGPIHYVALPSNVLLAYGWINDGTQWVIQVAHVTNGSSSMPQQRRVVSRTFTENDDGDLDFEIDCWIEHLDTTGNSSNSSNNSHKRANHEVKQQQRLSSMSENPTATTTTTNSLHL